MSVDLTSADFALIVYVEHIGSGIETEVDLRAFSGVLDEAHFAPEGERYISAREQMSIVFDPPSVEIVDHSGVMSAGSRMIEAATLVLDIFQRSGYEMSGHGWRIEGRVHGVGSDHFAAVMLQRDQLSRLGSSDGPSTPKLVLLGLEVPSQVMDEVMFTIRLEDDELHVMALSLMKEPLAFARAEENSAGFAAEVHELLAEVLL